MQDAQVLVLSEGCSAHRPTLAYMVKRVVWAWQVLAKSDLAEGEAGGEDDSSAPAAGEGGAGEGTGSGTSKENGAPTAQADADEIAQKVRPPSQDVAMVNDPRVIGARLPTPLIFFSVTFPRASRAFSKAAGPVQIMK